MREKAPGWPAYNYGRPYGFEEHLRKYGSGVNMLRTVRVAQPQALKRGDILATGERILAEPRQGFNGAVWVKMTGGNNGHWIELPSRIPLALLTEEDNAPDELWKESKRKRRKK